MNLIVVDVEADGPIPGVYSMVNFAAVAVQEDYPSFYSLVKPISDKWIPDALKVSGYTREQQLLFNEDPSDVMKDFADWLSKFKNPVLISDNNQFDGAYMNYYFHMFYGNNPFGHSSRRIGDLYTGMNRDMRSERNWKKLRKFRHTHNPLDDDKGNASALLEFKKMGLKW